MLTYHFFFQFQDEIRSCMNEIEVSINLSMSGMSFQPNNNNNNNNVVPPKQQKQQQKQDYISTTPTDVMDIAKTCVY